MNDRDIEMLGVGMDLGIYVAAKLASEGLQTSPEGWERISKKFAANVEAQMGVPAEDLALMVQPVIDSARNQIGNAES